jgi:tRNA G18 (ribose-2'-O)-methylase SpoU
MSSSRLSLSRPTGPAASLDLLPPVGAAHLDVRRYSKARRNLLPRGDHVTAVSGTWALAQVLHSGAVVESALWCPAEPTTGRCGDEATWAAVAERAERAHRISGRTLARMHPGLTAPALVAVVRLPRWRPDDVFTEQAHLVLVADGIEYAGNLGTLVRTADACAADAVLLTSAVARVTHPKTFVASRGTVLTMPVVEYPTVAQAVADLAAAGFTAYVADPAGTTSYREAGLGSGRTAVVVGSEGEGVSPEWRSGLARVAIPMRGRADSLNVATSAAVLLFEARAALDHR